MRKSRLIQQLLKPDADEANSFTGYGFGSGLKNGGFTTPALRALNKCFEFRWMGDAAYEYGAVPEALSMIHNNREHYLAYSLTVNPHGDASIMAVLYAISRAADRPEVEDRIKIWAANEAQLPTNDPIQLSRTLQLWIDSESQPEVRLQGWFELENAFFFFISEKMWEATAKLLDVKIVSI